MRVLITTDWYEPVINGVVTSVMNLSRQLRERGHEVKILTLSRTFHSYIEGDVVYAGSIGLGCIYPQARLKIPKAAGDYMEMLLEWKPDIVHSQCEFSTFFLAKKIASELHVPIVHTYHTVYEDYTHNRNMCGESRVSSAVGLAAVQTARDLKAKAIVTPTFGGRTARLISNFRPEAPIYAVTPNDTILHRLQLVWGVTPLKGYEKDSTEHIISQAMSVVRRKRLAKKGDLIVFTVGDPATNMTREGAVTNMLHVIEAK